jgi:hypothetical protein
VLLNASVIGREFSRKLIERVINGGEEVTDPLNHLKGLELILERDEVQEFEYLFKHYMIQEVAYNTILINKRKKLHGMIANAIEEIYVDRLKGLYELLAFHYEKAEEWEKAAEYYGRAGRKVREIYTEEESKDFFERKEFAMEKLYESKPQGSLRMTILLLASFGFLIVLFTQEIFLAMDSMDWKVIVFEFLIFDIMILWGLLILLFYFVIPLLNPVKIFDLMSDRIEILLGKNKIFAIPFSDIEFIRFVIPQKGLFTKILYKEVDQFNAMNEYKEISFGEYWQLFRNKQKGVGFDIGLPIQKGKLIIGRKAPGISWFYFLLPWKRSLIFERGRYGNLFPSEPEEFFDQLSVAYEKWKRANPRPPMADKSSRSHNL